MRVGVAVTEKDQTMSAATSRERTTIHTMTSGRTPGTGQARANSGVAMAERTAEAYELKLRGHTHREIAEIMGAPKSTVHDWLTKAINERVEPLVEEYRAVMVDRRERSLVRLEKIYDRALEAGNDELALRTHDRMLREDESLRRLKGIDAPTQITGDLTVNYRLVSDGQVDDGALT